MARLDVLHERIALSGLGAELIPAVAEGERSVGADRDTVVRKLEEIALDGVDAEPEPRPVLDRRG